MELRAYTAGAARATSVIFLRAVRETARAHYSPEQVEAWAANYGDLDSWAAARAAAHTQLAIIDGHVAGFTDLDDHGYIDMLFVDPVKRCTAIARTTDIEPGSNGDLQRTPR